MIPTETTLETENYRLRIPNKTDINFVFSASRYPGFNDGMQWDAPISKSELVAPLEGNRKSWVEGTGYGFTIESKTKPPERLGRISIRRTEEKDLWDVGYWTHPEHQKKGVLTEALGAILTFGFSRLSALKIRARYAIWNKASEKVLIKNGFKFSKHLEKGFIKKGEWIRENEFCLTKAQWKGAKAILESCDFCDVLKGNENTIFEDKDLMILLDIDPIALGHVILCPKKHYTDFHDMPDDLIQKMNLLAKKYILALQNIFPAKGYSMMLNAGAFNDLKHCHLHIFPRNAKEEFQWLYSEEKLPEDAARFEVLKQLIAGYI